MESSAGATAGEEVRDGGNRATISETEPAGEQHHDDARSQGVGSSNRATAEPSEPFPAVLPTEVSGDVKIEITAIIEPIELAPVDTVSSGIRSEHVLPLLKNCALRISAEDISYKIEAHHNSEGVESQLLVLTVERALVTPARTDDESDQEVFIDVLGEEVANELLVATTTDYLLMQPDLLRIVVGEIPNEKMVQVMTVMEQCTGWHGCHVVLGTN